MKVSELMKELSVFNQDLQVEVEIMVAGVEGYRDGFEHREVYEVDAHKEPYGSGSAPIVRLRT